MKKLSSVEIMADGFRLVLIPAKAEMRYLPDAGHRGGDKFVTPALTPADADGWLVKNTAGRMLMFVQRWSPGGWYAQIVRERTDPNTYRVASSLLPGSSRQDAIEKSLHFAMKQTANQTGGRRRNRTGDDKAAKARAKRARTKANKEVATQLALARANERREKEAELERVRALPRFNYAVFYGPVRVLVSRTYSPESAIGHAQIVMYGSKLDPALYRADITEEPATGYVSQRKRAEILRAIKAAGMSSNRAGWQRGYAHRRRNRAGDPVASLVSMLRSNADAYHAGRVSHAAFSKRNASIWSRIHAMGRDAHERALANLRAP